MLVDPPSLDDLYQYGAPTAVFGSLTDPQRTAGIQSAFDTFLGYVRARGQGDLIAYDTSCKSKICHVAAYELLSVRGFNPNAGADRNYIDRNNAALMWFQDIGRSKTTPGLVFDVDKSIGSMPQVTSRKPLGW